MAEEEDVLAQVELRDELLELLSLRTVADDAQPEAPLRDALPKLGERANQRGWRRTINAILLCDGR